VTPGQAHDILGFGALFRIIDEQVEMLMADRDYDADVVRADIAFVGTRAVVPAKRGRRHPATHNAAAYRLQNRIERMFNKLKNWRRVATRYDKTTKSFLGFV